MIYADQRWVGEHGIGRFAREVLCRVAHQPLSLRSHPASPFDSLRLAKALHNMDRGDVFFSPGYNAPLWSHGPFVFTIHDLNHIDRPENSSQLKRLYYAAFLRNACRRSARVLTVSEFSRRKILEWSGLSEERVVNVGLGLDPQYGPIGEAASFGTPYLLCVSNRKPHKNEFRTIEAFQRSGLFRELQLVMTGAPAASILKRIEELGLRNRIQFTGYVAESELPKLYRGAVGLIFVSLYEGFGLPALEAMGCGTPVLTSSTSALPETVGDSALLVDPMAVDAIAQGMRQLAYDSSVRVKLRNAGLTRARSFTWPSTVGKVTNVLNEIVGPSDRL